MNDCCALLLLLLLLLQVLEMQPLGKAVKCCATLSSSHCACLFMPQLSKSRHVLHTGLLEACRGVGFNVYLLLYSFHPCVNSVAVCSSTYSRRTTYSPSP
jgi:hypothetical protein